MEQEILITNSSANTEQHWNEIKKIATCLQNVSESWHYGVNSGHCHSYAVALANILNKYCSVPFEAMKVLLAERISPEDDHVFSHAVLKVLYDYQLSLIVDSRTEEADEQWELSWNFYLDDCTKSDFIWHGAASNNISDIGKIVAEIDGSLPPSAAQIEDYTKNWNRQQLFC